MSTLTEAVRRAGREAGADLVGFAPVSRFEHAPPEFHPRSIFPPVRTAVAVAVKQQRGSLKAVEDGAYWQAYNCDNYWYLNEVVGPQVLRAIVLLLEEHGYTSVPVHNPFCHNAGKQIRDDQVRGPDGMISLRVIGAAAGLGELGRSKVFLTPQFGPRQRVFAVLTDAELEPTPLFRGTICDDCMACVKGCQAGAIGDGERAHQVQIEDVTFSHAELDCAACGEVHRGDDPRFSPFRPDDLPKGEQDRYVQFVRHRFRHCAICVGRGCLRSCLDHLEKTGRIEATFQTPMIQGKRWQVPQ